MSDAVVILVDTPGTAKALGLVIDLHPAALGVAIMEDRGVQTATVRERVGHVEEHVVYRLEESGPVLLTRHGA